MCADQSLPLSTSIRGNPRIMDVFLQILGAARVTVATGETLDLSRFYVVMDFKHRFSGIDDSPALQRCDA